MTILFSEMLQTLFFFFLLIKRFTVPSNTHVQMSEVEATNRINKIGIDGETEKEMSRRMCFHRLKIAVSMKY